MSEAEFDQLLDAVGAAIGPSPHDFLLDTWRFDELPRAANDNGLAWPMIPFPEGWTASC